MTTEQTPIHFNSSIQGKNGCITLIVYTTNQMIYLPTYLPIYAPYATLPKTHVIEPKDETPQNQSQPSAFNGSRKQLIAWVCGKIAEDQMSRNDEHCHRKKK